MLGELWRDRLPDTSLMEDGDIHIFEALPYMLLSRWFGGMIGLYVVFEADSLSCYLKTWWLSIFKKGIKWAS